MLAQGSAVSALSRCRLADNASSHSPAIPIQTSRCPPRGRRNVGCQLIHA